MTALIDLGRDLILRRGEVTFAVNRLLDRRTKVQLENQSTGEYVNLGVEEFYKRVRDGDYVPISGTQTVPERDTLDLAIVDTTQLPEAEKDHLDIKQRVIKLLKKAGLTRGQRREISEKLPELVERINDERAKIGKVPIAVRMQASTVMTWWRKFEEAGQNITSLISGNLFRRRKTGLHEKVEALIDDTLDKHFLTRERHTLTHAYGELKKALTKAVKDGSITKEAASVSFPTYSRRMHEIDPYIVKERRFGTSAARHQFRATLDGTRATRALERVEIDHTLLNWIVVCDRTGLPLGRPTLTIAVDSYSGYIVGLYVSFNGPGITSVLKTIKSSILPKTSLALEAGCQMPWAAWGVGDTFLLDNGLEFHCNVFRHVAWELSTDVEYCAVRQPWVKPHAERTLLNLDFIAVSNGRVHKPVPNAVVIDPKEYATITLSNLTRGLILWAADVHGQTFHSRWFCKPYEKFCESIQISPPPTMPLSLAGLDLIAAMHKTLTVSSGGVELRGLSYAGGELPYLLRDAGGKFRSLVKWDPDNMGRVHVQHPRTGAWHVLECTRPDFAEGLTWRQLLTIRKALRELMHESTDSVDRMAAAKDRLREIWLEPLTNRTSSSDRDAAKRFAKVSASVAPPVTPPAKGPALLVSEPEFQYQVDQIPDFDVVQFS